MKQKYAQLQGLERIKGCIARSPLDEAVELAAGMGPDSKPLSGDYANTAFVNPVLAEKGMLDSAVFKGAAPANELQAYLRMEEPWMPEAMQGAGITAGFTGLPAVNAIDLKILLQEIFGLMRPNYNLRSVCHVVNMPQLKASLPVFTKMTAQQKVPEFVEAEVGAGAWQTVDFLLWKNVMHIAMSDEAQARALVDVWGSMVKDAAGALAAAENSQIATALSIAGYANSQAVNGTGGSGGVWTDNGQYSAACYNPMIDITLAIRNMWSAGFKATHIVMHPSMWATYLSNRFVKGMLNGVVMPQEVLNAQGEFPVPGFPGITGVSDLFVVAANSTGAGSSTDPNTCYVLAKDAAMGLGVGPTEAAQYRNEAKTYTAYIVRQYLQVQAIVKQAVIGITGITS